MDYLRTLMASTALAGLTFLSVASIAPAEAHAAGNSTVAEALFSEGRRLLDEGNYDQACAKFAESQRLDPGTGTLLNLANCYEKAGRKASAWTTWKEAASSARDQDQDEREQYARERAAELGADLAKLTIVLAPGVEIDGLVVKRGDEELPSAILGAPLPVDAQTHIIEASAPGYETFTTEVTIKDGEAQTVEIPALVQLPESELPAEGTPAPAAATSATPVDENPGKNQRMIGYIVGGVGVAGLGAGAAFGILAINKNNDSLELCPAGQSTCGSQEGVDLRNDAKTFGTVSSVAIGVGAAALVGGVTLILTAPKAKTQVSAVPTLGGGALLLSGQF